MAPTASTTGSCLCGGNLFWQPAGRDQISIMASKHIYVGSAADYHQICDGLPQHEEGHIDES